jgi:hypothetical protein
MLRIFIILCFETTLASTIARAGSITSDASASTHVSIPGQCGSVCVPAQDVFNSGTISNGVISSSVSLDQVEFAQARINLSTGTAGVIVANDIGSSNAQASHFDVWYCSDPVLCAALTVNGSFVPVTLDLHVSGNASLTPGAMDLQYQYTVSSLLGSTALGTFSFDFGEDPGTGLNADVGGTADFFDNHTLVDHAVPVLVQSQGFNTGQISFSANLVIQTYIGGCTSSPCDLSQGIFTDTQSLNAFTDPGSDGSAQVLDSSNTFQITLTSDLPLVSADGRIGGPVAAAVPEPSSIGLVLVGIGLLAIASRRLMRVH